LGTAESWAGLETYKVTGHTSYFKGRCKTAKHGRNPGGLAVYVKDDTSKRIKEISKMIKEILQRKIVRI
jgi:hypothetical protein